MRNNVINWGVLGCGRIAERKVVPAIISSDNSCLYAVAESRLPERLENFKNKFNPQKAYSDYEELLNDPCVNAVYISLPNSFHLKWTLKAIEHNKHVLCEKPLGLNANEVLVMKEAARKKGVLLVEAFDFIHNPAIAKFKEMLPLVGRVHLIEGLYDIYLEQFNDFRKYKHMGGGAIYDVGCYLITLLQYLLEESPENIKAFAIKHPETGVDMEDACLFSYGDGTIAMLHCSFKCSRIVYVRVIGEKGILEYIGELHANGDVQIKHIFDGKVETTTINCPDSYKLQIMQFEGCIFKGEKPRLSLEETYENMKTLEHLFREIEY